MLSHARDAAPREACGVIAGGQVIRITNVSQQPEAFFEMDVTELLAVYRNYATIEGVYHSHPGGNPKPSPTDREGAPPDLPYYIVTLDEVYEYVLANH